MGCSMVPAATAAATWSPALHPHPWAAPAALHREEQGDQSHGLHHAGQQGLQEWKGARRGGGCKHRRARGSSSPPPPTPGRTYATAR